MSDETPQPGGKTTTTKNPNEIDSQLKCFSVKTSGKGQDRREIKKKVYLFFLFFNLKIQSIFFPFYLTKSKTGERKNEREIERKTEKRRVEPAPTKQMAGTRLEGF